MNVNEILDIMDDMLDSAWTVPLSGGKCMVEVDRLRELISDVRLNMPQEIKQAKLIVTDRKIILDDAKKEAENILRTAEQNLMDSVNQIKTAKSALRSPGGLK